MSPRDTLLVLIPPLCWGVGFAVAKPAVMHFPPLFMMLAIYAGIALVLTFAVRKPVVTPWPQLLLISAFAVTIQGAFLFIGLQGLPAGVATLVLQTQVPFAVLLGWLIGGESLSLRKIAGTLVAFAGVAIVVGLPERAPPLLPVMLVILAALFWATGQVLARRLGRDSGIVQLKGLAIAAVPQLAIATILLESRHLDSITTAGWREWSAFLFVGVIGFYVPYVLWYALLRRHRVDDVAPFTLLMPVVGVAAAALLLAEPILLTHLIGGMVIIAGLAIVVGIGMPRMRVS
jgi:O-acetylserine/cysteine efflux transporter